MKILTMIAAPMLALAGPAFAGPDCTGGSGPLTPMWKLAQAFENDGGTIETMQVTAGCYEIYGKQANLDVEIYFDPRSLAELQREEG